jgi:hypothetical protein
MGQDKPFTHIKEVIDTIFATSALPIDLDDMRIWKLWDAVVGKRVAQHARPSWIKKGVLMVKVTDSVWLQELEFKAELLREALNRKLHREAIKKIRFRVGTPQDKRKRERKSSHHEHSEDLTPERQGKMEEILARIKDKQMRESLRQIMTLAARKDNVR